MDISWNTKGSSWPPIKTSVLCGWWSTDTGSHKGCGVFSLEISKSSLDLGLDTLFLVVLLKLCLEQTDPEVLPTLASLRFFDSHTTWSVATGLFSDKATKSHEQGKDMRHEAGYQHTCNTAPAKSKYRDWSCDPNWGISQGFLSSQLFSLHFGSRLCGCARLKPLWTQGGKTQDVGKEIAVMAVALMRMQILKKKKKKLDIIWAICYQIPVNNVGSGCCLCPVMYYLEWSWLNAELVFLVLSKYIFSSWFCIISTSLCLEERVVLSGCMHCQKKW